MKKRAIKKCVECNGGGGRYHERCMNVQDGFTLEWEKCRDCNGCGVVQNFEMERKSPYRN